MYYIEDDELSFWLIEEVSIEYALEFPSRLDKVVIKGKGHVAKIDMNPLLRPLFKRFNNFQDFYKPEDISNIVEVFERCIVRIIGGATYVAMINKDILIKELSKFM